MLTLNDPDLRIAALGGCSTSAWERLEAAWLLAAHRHVETQYKDVDWFDDDACHCRCPGEDFHNNPTAHNHCRVYLDANPVPTVACMHQSCDAVIARHNQVLRGWWKDSMSGRGLGLSDEDLAALAVELRAREQKGSEEQITRNQERDALGALRQWGLANRRQILREHAWTSAQIQADSPSVVPADVRSHWRLILSRYSPTDTIWIADEVFHSGEWKNGRNFSDRFRTVNRWLHGTDVPGVYICPARLDERAERRTDDNVVNRPFMVAESDVLKRDEVGAVFQWIIAQGLRLRFVVDTGSKSLHGWFEAPDENQLRCLGAILPELGIDPKVLRRTQPVRLPGALNPKSGNPQRLIYCDLLP